MVGAIEYFYRHAQFPIKIPVELIHQHYRNILMMNALHNGLLQRVRKWPMADVMQQDGYGYGLFLGFCDHLSLVSQGFHRHIHQVHGAEGMMKTGMQSAGINQVRHAQLFDVT